jgi:D-amino-acid dehydrogenase
VFARCGSLVVALAEHEERWFLEVRARALVRDPGAEECGGEEARRRFPPLGTPWRALFSPAAARMDGRLLTAGLRHAASRRGVTIVRAEARGVERTGDRVTGVRARDAVTGCDHLVLAGGAWSAACGRWVGADLAVTPTKGQIAHVHIDAGVADSGSWPIVQPVANFYLVPWPQGRVACGGTFEPEAGYDIHPTVAGVRDLLRECAVIAPGLAGAALGEVRVGLRPTSADGRPLLGPLASSANVHVCSGHGAEGLLLGPYSARLVADGILGRSRPGSIPYPADRR